MPTEHSTITSADCHEPKGITSATTADAGKVITPSSSTNGESTLRKVTFAELDASAGSSNEVFIADGAGSGSWGTLTNTARDAQAYMHTSTVTTISGGDGDSGNPKLVNGSTNWSAATASQFTVSTGGRLTYTGTSSITVHATVCISGTTAAGTETIRHYIAKNGTVVTGSMTELEYVSTAVNSPPHPPRS